MTQGEFVAGLEWVIKIRPQLCICKDCGRQAYPYGVQAVTCQRSGSITKGHRALRDTAAELLANAGISAAPEQRLPI